MSEAQIIGQISSKDIFQQFNACRTIVTTLAMTVEVTDSYLWAHILYIYIFFEN